MNLLVDIGHPGHVHLFKNLIVKLRERGAKITVTTKNILSAIQLLKSYNIDFQTIGDKYDHVLLKAINQPAYNLRLRRIVRMNNISLGIGSTVNLAHVSVLTRMQSVIFDDDDDDVEPLFVRYAHPFCDHLLSPEALKDKQKRKSTIYYPGYHELAYLHPNWFTPDKSVPGEAGLNKNDRFFILRFVAMKGHHDLGHQGLTLNQKLILIETLKKYGRPLISTERDIDPELCEYGINISPEKIHSLLFYSSLFIGDSQTMTSEAAILGTPALKCNSFAGKLSVPDELENLYKLCFSFLPEQFDKMIEKINELLKDQNLRTEWQKRRQAMLNDKIDVSSFMIWFVENYPDSVSILKDNQEYPENFR